MLNRLRISHLVVGTVGVLLFLWFWCDYLIFFPLRRGFEKTGLNLSSFLKLRNGAFQDGFSKTIVRVFNPAYATRATGSSLWFLLVVIAASWFFGQRLLRQDDQARSIWWPVLALPPFVLALFVAPMRLKYLFGVMATNHVGNTWYIGEILAVSLSPVYLGLIASIALTGALFFTRRRFLHRYSGGA